MDIREKLQKINKKSIDIFDCNKPYILNEYSKIDVKNIEYLITKINFIQSLLDNNNDINNNSLIKEELYSFHILLSLLLNEIS